MNIHGFPSSNTSFGTREELRFVVPLMALVMLQDKVKAKGGKAEVCCCSGSNMDYLEGNLDDTRLHPTEF